MNKKSIVPKSSFKQKSKINDEKNITKKKQNKITKSNVKETKSDKIEK